MVHKSETDGVNLSPKDAKLDTLKKKPNFCWENLKLFFSLSKKSPFLESRRWAFHFNFNGICPRDNFVDQGVI